MLLAYNIDIDLHELCKLLWRLTAGSLPKTQAILDALTLFSLAGSESTCWTKVATTQ